MGMPLIVDATTSTAVCSTGCVPHRCRWSLRSHSSAPLARRLWSETGSAWSAPDREPEVTDLPSEETAPLSEEAALLSEGIAPSRWHRGIGLRRCLANLGGRLFASREGRPHPRKRFLGPRGTTGQLSHGIPIPADGLQTRAGCSPLRADDSVSEERTCWPEQSNLGPRERPVDASKRLFSRRKRVAGHGNQIRSWSRRFPRDRDHLGATPWTDQRLPTRSPLAA